MLYFSLLPNNSLFSCLPLMARIMLKIGHVEVGVIYKEMEKMAVVFPGQGSQRPGMGKDFFDSIEESRRVYEEASEALGWDVAAMCFSEDERLNLTQYTQPCLLTTEIAMVRGLQKEFPSFRPAYFGGHSLGEFTALVAAGVLPLKEAVKIVHIRGKLMQEAVPVGEGGMAAVISPHLDLLSLKEIIADLPLDVANENSLHQVVISGKREALPEAEKRLKETLGRFDGFRFVMLNVSAPFHSRFMEPIEEKFAETLRKWGTINHSLAPQVTSNFTGDFHLPDREAISRALVAQLSHTVRWIDNMRALTKKADRIFELGPSRPLREFFKSVNAECLSINSLTQAARLFAS